MWGAGNTMGFGSVVIDGEDCAVPMLGKHYGAQLLCEFIMWFIIQVGHNHITEECSNQLKSSRKYFPMQHEQSKCASNLVECSVNSSSV
jgi:hypothetical protein